MQRFDDDGDEALWPQTRTIWIVNPFDDIPGEGLPPLRYWSLARVLASRGHEVIWWTADFSHRRKAARRLPMSASDLAAEEGFAVRLVPVRAYSRNVSLARLASHRDFGRNFERMATAAVAEGTISRPDVILASLPPLEGPEAAARLAAKLDAAFVVDLMDLWPETFHRALAGPAWLKAVLARLLLGGMERRRDHLLESADAISSSTLTYAAVALSTTSESAATPRHVCRLGATAGLPDDSAVHRGDVAHHGEATLNCVYAGSLEAGQDVECVLEAAKLLSKEGISVRIHVAGTGHMLPALKAAAADLPATASCRISFHGLLDRRAYARLLSTCDVGLVCVKPETLVAIPYKACDYAMAGLALVNSLDGELGDLVEQYQAGIPYTAGSGGSLAGAIARFASDPRLLTESRRGARRLGEAEFDREKLYNHFADWLETVARQPAPPATHEAISLPRAAQEAVAARHLGPVTRG